MSCIDEQESLKMALKLFIDMQTRISPLNS
jgi:hypothetical protein